MSDRNPGRANGSTGGGRWSRCRVRRMRGREPEGGRPEPTAVDEISGELCVMPSVLSPGQSGAWRRVAMERGVADRRGPSLHDGHQLVGDAATPMIGDDRQRNGTVVVDRCDSDQAGPGDHTESHRAIGGESFDQLC